MIKNLDYINTPRAHQSTFLSWPAWDTISGAKYSGVPQKLIDNSSKLINNQIDKIPYDSILANP